MLKKKYRNDQTRNVEQGKFSPWTSLWLPAARTITIQIQKLEARLDCSLSSRQTKKQNSISRISGMGSWISFYDNDEIKADFNELYQKMNGMTIRDMDKVIYPVCKLCRDHEKSGFIEGIKIGIHLVTEIT